MTGCTVVTGAALAECEMRFFGVDVETSAIDLEDEAALIQIGIATRGTVNADDMAFTGSYVNPGDMYWDEESAAVHKISRETVNEAPEPAAVDEQMKRWLIDAGAHESARGQNIPVGWNVSGFDMPFIRRYLPYTYWMFSRRTVDLNALCFALDGKFDKNWEQWKGSAKDYATEKFIVNNEFRPHDARWDAVTSLLAFEYLRHAILR